MRRFYAPIANFQNQQIVLNLEETRHLRDVLRLREGEKISVFDGEGGEFLCQIKNIARKETILDIIEEISPAAPESNLNLTLAIALLKGEKFDLIVQKAVELGITTLVPIITKRCDVKLKDADKKVERWQKIVLESSKQCGRAKLMAITSPVNFELFIKNKAAQKQNNEQLLLFSEKNGGNFSSIKSEKKITALVGPEGGWDDSEIEFAEANKVQIITLGGRILRAETAGFIIPALLQNHYGDLS